MVDCQWSLVLAAKVIKEIINNGRSNAARRRNQELATSGAVVKVGRPPKSREAFESPILARKRALPVALPQEEIARQLFESQRKRMRCGCVSPNLLSSYSHFQC